MRLPTLPAEGGCRCGTVWFQLNQPPVMTAICHCRGCQRMTGGAYSATAMVPEAGFAVLRGSPVRGGTREGAHAHRHCPDCHGWLFTQLGGGMEFVNVRATLLDDPSWFSPFIESQTAEALPWALVAAPHSYPRFPDMADYPVLMTPYADAAAAGV